MIATGKIVYSLLAANQQLQALVGDKIYPLVAEEKTLLPFVIYERTYSNEFNHDNYKSTSVFTITVLSETYSDGVDIAEAINNTLNNYSGEVLNTRVLKILNSGGGEAYAEGIYVQKIEYLVITCS